MSREVITPPVQMKSAWRLRITRYSDVGTHIFVPLLVLTLPLEFTAMYFPAQIIQVRRIVMVLGLVLLGSRFLMSRDSVVVPKRFSLALLAALIAYEVVSSFVARSPSGARSVLEDLIYFAVLIAVYNFSRTQDDLWRAWGALAISGLIIGVLTIFLYVANLDIWRPGLPSYLHRVNATFGDPNILGRFLAITTATSIMLVASVPNKIWRFTALASAVVGTIAVIFTYSRAGWLVFALTLILAVLLTKHRRNAFVALGVAICIVGAVAVTNHTVFRRTQDILSLITASSAASATRSGPSHSASFGLLDRIPLDVERHYLIAAGLKMFVDHPLFGVGFGEFRSNISGRYSYFVQPGYPDRLSHTSLVTVLAELGVVGLTLLVAWLVWLFREVFQFSRSWHGDKFFLFVPIPAIFAVLLHSQFEERLLSEPYLWVFIALLYAAQSRLADAANRAR